MDEFARFELLIGKEKMQKLKQSTVLILGLGGVGSYATESLVRSGIGHFILVDFDVIDITNLNRQLMATQENIGEYKVDVWEKRIRQINPLARITKIQQKLLPQDIEPLFQTYAFQYVIDACDTVSTKCALIKACLNHHTTIISSMGTGNKMDPTQLEIIDIRKTSYDPLARVIRKMIKDMKMNQKVMVVCSKERPQKRNDPIIASNAFVPATAGLFCASYIVDRIVGEKNEH